MAVEIPLTQLIIAILLLAIPIVASLILKLKLIKPMWISISRMIIQLFLIGLFLKYLFYWNSSILNILWLIIMIIFAVFTTLKNSEIRIKNMLFPTFISFAGTTFSVVFYLNYFVLRLDKVFDARYLVVLGGMLLGNALRGNIIGLMTFYKDLEEDRKHYHYLLVTSADKFESILPYLQNSMISAMKPSIASMATMGIVSLPGMMTGQILEGAAPMAAIKYQIMIMTAIFVSSSLAILITILITSKINCNAYGVLDATKLKS